MLRPAGRADATRTVVSGKLLVRMHIMMHIMMRIMMHLGRIF